MANTIWSLYGYAPPGILIQVLRWMESLVNKLLHLLINSGVTPYRKDKPCIVSAGLTWRYENNERFTIMQYYEHSYCPRWLIVWRIGKGHMEMHAVYNVTVCQWWYSIILITWCWMNDCGWARWGAATGFLFVDPYFLLLAPSRTGEINRTLSINSKLIDQTLKICIDRGTLLVS